MHLLLLLNFILYYFPRITFSFSFISFLSLNCCYLALFIFVNELLVAPYSLHQHLLFFYVYIFLLTTAF